MTHFARSLVRLKFCDFSLEYLKLKVYQTRLRNSHEVKQRVTEEVQKIPQELLEKVFESFSNEGPASSRSPLINDVVKKKMTFSK